MINNVATIDALQEENIRLHQRIAELERRQAMQQRIEADLRHSEERLTRALEGSSDAVWDWNMATGELYVSPYFLHLLGYRSDEIDGHMSVSMWRNLIHPDDMLHVVRVLRNHIEGQTSLYEVEYRLLTCDDTWRWVLDRGKIIVRDNQGRPQRMTGTSTDITERKAREQTLRTSVAIFGQRVLAQTDLAALMDDALNIVTCTLGVEYGNVFEYLSAQHAFLLRAGVGWQEQYTDGRFTLSADTDSPCGYTLLSNEPVIVDDMTSETRFGGSLLLRDHAVVSSINVAIQGRERPFGVLGAHSSQQRKFTEDDMHFLQSIAAMLAVVIERMNIENELERQRTFLRQVIDINPNLIFARDCNGRFTLVNHAVAHLYETTTEELIGKTDADVNPHTEAVDKIRQEDLEVMTTRREKVILEKRITDTSGKSRWLQTVKRPITDSDGTVSHVLGVAVDITKRKQAEEALRQSKNRLRRILDSSPDGVLVLDKQRRIRYTNPMARTLLNQNDLESQPFQSPPLTDESTEVEITHRDGSMVVVEMRVIETDWEDQRAYVVSLRDMTERKRMETALRESRTRLQAIFDNAAVGICLIAPDGRFIEVNDRVAEMLGYSVEEFLQYTHLDFAIPEDRPPTQQRLGRLMRGEVDAYQVEKRFVHKDGTIVWFNVSMTSIHSETRELEAMIAIVTDISERKQAEEALKYAYEQQVAELEGYNREITLLNAMSDRLHRAQTAKEMFTIVEQFAEQLFAHQSGGVYLFNATEATVEAVTCWGALPSCEFVFDAVQCRILQSDVANRMEDFSCSLACERMGFLELCSHICVPLIIHGEKIGILRLCGSSHTSVQTYNTMCRLTRIVAEHLVLALTNLRMRERLREMAIRDALTGLFNRRYLDETLVRELRRARRYQHTVGVIMLDIDHFKQFNDTYGHDAGDTLLREMAAFLQKQIRTDDIACRYGGEEFILILPGAGLADTQKRAEEVRTGVKGLEVKHDGQWLGRITISLGVAVFPDHGETDEEVIKAADKALFRAKRRGRDQVITGWRKGTTGAMEVVQG